MNLKGIKLLFLTILSFLLCMCENNNSPTEEFISTTSVENDSYSYLNSSALQNKILNEGDTLAYQELFNRKWKADAEYMIFWAQILAYKFNWDKGYLDIYWITLQTYLMAGIPYSEIDSKTKEHMLDCLVMSANLGNTDATSLIKTQYPDLVHELK